jgi:kynureninase
MTDFAATRALFDLPSGVAYLDGNSLGPLPRAAVARMERRMREEWGGMLIGGWNKAGWMAQPRSLGDRIGRLIGAEPGHVVLGDTLSIKVFQALAACLAMRPDRRVVLSDLGNFPSDLYMAEGLAGMLGRGHALRTPEPEAVEAAIGEDVAVLMLTEVDYRTGRRHDMARLTRKAHEAGALVVWDLAHSAGALPVDVAGGGADFAVGCTYKFLNGVPALSGWLGHRAPFAFEPSYRPGEGIERMRVGTPPVLAMAALEAAMDVWDGVDMEDLRRESLRLGDRFIAGVERACPELVLATPREHERRGSQVSFRHPEGYAVMQALIARGVVGDFRAPDILRFGITPLYVGEAEIDRAVEALAEVMAERLWDRAEYRKRAAVT